MNNIDDRCPECKRKNRWVCEFCRKNDAYGTISVVFHYGSKYDTIDMPVHKRICDECYKLGMVISSGFEKGD